MAMAPAQWFWVIGWMLTAVTVVGNGIVIYLIITRRRLRTTTNLFVVSLAAADFGLGASYIPLMAACNVNLSCAGGLIRYCIVILFNCSSMINLCVLTLDRYLAIVNPLRYVIFANRGNRVKGLICAAWATPILLFLAPYVSLELTATDENYEFYQKCFWGCLSLVEMFVCVALLLATVCILRIARRHARQNFVLMAQLNFNHRSGQTKARAPQEVAPARVISVVVSVFIFYYCLDIFDNVCYVLSYEVSFALLDVVSLLMLVNSAVNPIAYAFFKKDIKSELQRLLPCIPRRKSNAIHMHLAHFTQKSA